MGKLTEADDVDLFVGGVEPDAEASAETARLIEECKKHPDCLRKRRSISWTAIRAKAGN
jgi:hypothetical protein